MNINQISDYLYDCRWCNFKEDIRLGRIKDIRFEKMAYDEGKKLLVIGEVEMIDGKMRYFSMPMAKKSVMPNDCKAVIMDGEIYTDALLEPDFWQSLMKLVNDHDGLVRFDNGWVLERIAIGSQDLIYDCLNETSKPLGVEQSNTTLNVGASKLAFKLERMLDFSYEINSELEMNEKLMREGCSFMPKSFGGLVWHMPEGKQASFGIIQEFVRNKGDMWSYLLNYLDERLIDGYLHQTNLTANSNPEFMNLIRRLSEKTHAMGESLSRPDSDPRFDPEQVDDRFIRGYEKQITVLSYRVKNIIKEHLDDLPYETRVQAENLVENWDKDVDSFIQSRLDKIRSSQDKGMINRVHGDFHLGQVMVTLDNDLKFIDFAGEPDLDMEQRKQKHLCVRDIAGMYRSIKGYLGAVAVENFAAHANDVDVAAERKAWALKAIKPLIDSASNVFLGEKSLADPWLSLEVLRKNLYEVRYEVGNRPNMAYVPIGGLSELLANNSNREDFNQLSKSGRNSHITR